MDRWSGGKNMLFFLINGIFVAIEFVLEYSKIINDKNADSQMILAKLVELAEKKNTEIDIALL